MRGAWQTPHGARPNREGMAATPCVPARRAQPPGRSLEPLSNGRPRGMIVAAATPYKIRLTGPASLVALSFQKNERAFIFAAPADRRTTLRVFCEGWCAMHFKFGRTSHREKDMDQQVLVLPEETDFRTARELAGLAVPKLQTVHNTIARKGNSAA